MAISKIKIGEVEHEIQTTIDNVVGLREALNSKPNTDTKNTAGSTDSSKKLFLIGAESQGENPQTYSQDTAYVGTDGHLYSNSSQVVNLASTQTISGAKTFTNALKILNGSAAGAFVLGANVNSTGLTANTRKLGRMGVPAFTANGTTVNSTVAGISFDAQQYANYADFGGHPNNASSIAPDVIRFVVANSHDNSVSGSRTLALQISKQNGLTDTAGAPASVLGAKFFVPLIANESITASGGVVGNVTGDLTGTATKSIGDEDGNNIKSTYATKTVASTSANGLLSSTDKSHIDSMWNVWSADGTNDTLVNKVQEVLSAFDRYPEGSTIVEVLASKVNTTTTVNGHALSDNVTVTKGDVGLSNVDNVKQYSASNPPPYPVTSVNGKTGAVTLAKGDIGLGNVDNVKQYSASNPPPYPVSSVAGKTGVVTLAKSDVGLGNVENKSSATIRSEITSSNVTTALGYTPVSKAGGTMNDGATLKFSTYGTRFITISGNSITADMSNETGGWAGNFAAVKHKDPNSTYADGTTTTTMLGWYGGATALNYIYMGGSYSDPYMKMTPTGQFTFKNTPKVGTTNVALATDIPTKLSDLTADASHRTVTDTEKATWNAKSDFSGSYNDLTNKPTIPTVNNGTLTIQKNGTNVATFTANQSGNATANITVPTTLEDISDTTSYVRMTSAERTKLSGIATGANKTTVDSALSSTSTNPVQNKVVNTALNAKMTSNGWGTTSTTIGTGNIIYGTENIHLVDDSAQADYFLTFPKKTGTIATLDDISSSNGTDTNTTYDLSASQNSTNGNAKINLTAGGSGSGTDSVTIKGTGGTTVTTDANGVVTINSPTSSSSGSTVSSEMPIISYTGTSYSSGSSYLYEGDTMYLHLKKIGGGAFQLGDRLELCATRMSVRSANEERAGEVRYRLRALFTQDITQDIIDNADDTISFAINDESGRIDRLFKNDSRSIKRPSASLIHIRVRRPVYTENGREYNAKFSNLITLEKVYSIEASTMVIK